MICETCGKDAPNPIYCVNCGAMRPRSKIKNDRPIKVRRGELVRINYFGKPRKARIKSVKRVNVIVEVWVSKRKRKLVKHRIEDLLPL